MQTQVKAAVASTVHENLNKLLDQGMPTLVPPTAPGLLGESSSVVDSTKGRGMVMIEEDGSVSVFDGVAMVSLAPKESLAEEQWFQLAFVFTRQSVTMYINGAMQHTVPCESDFRGHPFIIGRGFTGDIMNVDFWKRVLIRAEIAKLPKPVSDHAKVKFVAHSAEGEYQLAKSKADDLERREAIQRTKMKAAEKDVKKHEKEKGQREIRDKSEMKAEKERRTELAVKDKVNEQSQKDQQKERETKERKTKSNEEGEKEAAKTNEMRGKASRKEHVDKGVQRDQEEEQRASKEREDKAKQREEETNELNAKETAHKTELKTQQETQSKEVKSKEDKLQKEREDQEKREKAEAGAAQERQQKQQQTTQNEISNKETVSKSDIAKENQQKALGGVGVHLQRY